MTSIMGVALIYKSPAYADSVFDSFHKNTPGVEFLFIANDPEPELLQHLDDRGYQYVVNRNEPVLGDQGLDELGFDPPEYIRRVYQGWNRAVMEAATEYIVLVNSDHRFTPGWLDSLMETASPTRMVSPLSIEPKHRVRKCVFSDQANGTGAINGEFGHDPSKFNSDGFRAMADNKRAKIYTKGGVYQPVVMHRQTVIDAGLYPEGNPKGTFGDRALFEVLAGRGVEHVTYHDSVVYHFQEGEMLS